MMLFSEFQLLKALRDVKIEVTHRGNKHHTYRIAGLSVKPTNLFEVGLLYFAFMFNLDSLFLNYMVPSNCAISTSNEMFLGSLKYQF